MFKCTINYCLNQPLSLTLFWFGCVTTQRLWSINKDAPVLFLSPPILMQSTNPAVLSFKICTPFCVKTNGIIFQVGNMSQGGTVVPPVWHIRSMQPTSLSESEVSGYQIFITRLS